MADQIVTVGDRLCECGHSKEEHQIRSGNAPPVDSECWHFYSYTSGKYSFDCACMEFRPVSGEQCQTK